MKLTKTKISSVQRYVVLDVETTGLSPRYGDRVIEIGAVALESGRMVEEFQTLINIESPIPKAVQRIHGITDEMLIGKPKPDEIMPRFSNFIKDSILVAHNAKFDIGFIKSEFARLHKELSNEYFCTLAYSRKLYPGLINHKLPTVYRHLCGHISEDTRLHRALDDARLTAKIWMEMRK